ncbi:restriction system-associated AAA family ATPase [Vibrio vulnificus]|nr:restriction system-associated AAA family ATPase [Vibrio vulnificus]EME0077303.1 restriction system-associated AAA family ATPase [Vibrio vulnificus]MCU8365266.1 restriction system-associated AAA family ATPase [Vibrio vulnificus]MCU8369438.1 restriction system-associated AAA family ATPase [Vibrio vulnificus]
MYAFEKGEIMRLRHLKINSFSTNGGLFEGLDVWFGRGDDGKSNEPLAPLCLIGPNGSGKSQFLQLLAEIFQAAWFEHSPQEERTSANNDILFELSYFISPDCKGEFEEVKLVRSKKGRSVGPIELYRGENQEPVVAGTEEFGKYLPSIIVGYTSGDNETLSLPFLISRSGYADDVARAALGDSVRSTLPDNRLMLIDYGTNLEVLFSNLILGHKSSRDEILRHANLADLASCRCVVRLAHPAAPKAQAKIRKVTGRKGIQLTEELEDIISSLKRTATCWTVEEKTETYTFDFLIDDATREAFAYFWTDALSLYRSLHKLALLNDLAIPRAARKRLERAVKERRFASRLPEPQQEDMVFGFEEVRFWPIEGSNAVDYVSLSDGEHQQALVLGTYAMISEKNALFLFDEPESHFNPQWRIKFVERLLALTGKRASQEMLITSHAPFVPSDMHREQVLTFSRDNNQITVSEPEKETFGATYDSILASCFNVSPPISNIAKNRINELLESENIDEIENFLEDLGQSVERAFLIDHLRRLKKKNS